MRLRATITIDYTVDPKDYVINDTQLSETALLAFEQNEIEADLILMHPANLLAFPDTETKVNLKKLENVP